MVLLHIEAFRGIHDHTNYNTDHSPLATVCEGRVFFIKDGEKLSAPWEPISPYCNRPCSILMPDSKVLLVPEPKGEIPAQPPVFLCGGWRFVAHQYVHTGPLGYAATRTRYLRGLGIVIAELC